MPEKHLIALDLDGTLLTDKKEITPYTKRVIASAREQGHVVMIATGRPYRSSTMYYKELDLTTPIVNFNGALVHHPQDGTFGTYHSPMNHKTIHEIVEAMEQYEVTNILAEVMDDMYVHYDDRQLTDVLALGHPKVTRGDLRKFLREDPTSILIHANQSQVDDIRSHLSDVHAEVIEHRRWGAPFHIIEIVKKGINKAVGLKRVAEHYNIPTQHIIAFGDEDNDFEMIKFAGVGVAMGNAIPSLKEIANTSTLTNEEEGIAHFLIDHLKL
ncbi:Cof-type HAD-IIB family hydrolase [Priestia endophytica]|uniref:Cof-type HAD-IIB family hydrolase n=1 Tax=Priestia endophytica TaxID=135735 RepID=UPI000DCA8882|nr:Cof-type HAD-IIB family hydrolase [Priestia endophytica]RAS73762.1 phosphatase [Priestia endophytica]